MSNSDVIRMPKRFDYGASGEFNAAFGAALKNGNSESKTVMLDCSQMDYIDSAGIGLLVMSHKKAESNRAKMSIINLKPSAREILFLANLQKLIDIK